MSILLDSLTPRVRKGIYVIVALTALVFGVFDAIGYTNEVVEALREAFNYVVTATGLIAFTKVSNREYVVDAENGEGE